MTNDKNNRHDTIEQALSTLARRHRSDSRRLHKIHRLMIDGSVQVG